MGIQGPGCVCVEIVGDIINVLRVRRLRDRIETYRGAENCADREAYLAPERV